MALPQAVDRGTVDDARRHGARRGTLVAMAGEWEALAAAQQGVLARRQLTALGCDWGRVRNQVAARRWAVRTPRVVTTFTGELSWRQQVWVGVLHAGGSALVGGLTALEWHGLRNWHRDEVSVLVDDRLTFPPVPGVRFVGTRRDLRSFRHRRGELPLCRVEPAALLCAGYTRSARTGQGLLAAVVQQRLSTAQRLLDELETLTPLRRSRTFRRSLGDVGDGAHSMAELDVRRMCRVAGLPRPSRQVKRRDHTGRVRFTDCEWPLGAGRVLVLEVDGGFHMEVEHWEDDIVRQRRLTRHDRVLVRCTARELRDEPHLVARDLVALGLTA
jgi:hypothetical protein